MKDLKIVFLNNSSWFLLSIFLIYSFLFFYNITSIIPKTQQLKEISKSASIIRDSLEQEDITYMEKVETDLKNNPSFKKNYFIFVGVVFCGLGLGCIFLFLFILFRFLRIKVFKIEKVKISEYLKFNILDLIKFLLIYGSFYCVVKYILLGELLFFGGEEYDIKGFMGVNICLAVIFMNLLPCWFLIRYIRNKYKQGIEYLGLEFSKITKKIFFGIVAYITCYPLILFLLAGTFIITEFLKIKIPTHPIVPMILKDTSLANILLFVFIACIIGPITEEIFFRGLLYPVIKKRVGAVLAAVVSSALFACLHFNIPLVLSIFVLGLLFSYLYERTGSLVSSITVHILHNSLMVTIVLLIKLYL
jgi:uncharacterized protein